MKNKNILLLVCLLLFLTKADSQDHTWQLGSIVSIDQMSMNYTLTDDFNEEGKDHSSIHPTIELRFERKCNKHLAILAGVSLSNLNFKPKMILPQVYGTNFKIDDTEETLLYPLLHKQEINVVSVPVGLKYDISPNKRWSPYVSLLVSTGMKYQETETYQENFASLNGERKTLAIKDPGLQLFNIGLDMEAGVQFQVNEIFKIFLAPGIRILEFRYENEKFKRNGEMIYESEWMNLSQKELALGLLVGF